MIFEREPEVVEEDGAGVEQVEASPRSGAVADEMDEHRDHDQDRDHVKAVVVAVVKAFDGRDILPAGDEVGVEEYPPHHEQEKVEGAEAGAAAGVLDVGAKQKAREHEQSGNEQENVARKKHGNGFPEQDVVDHPPELIDQRNGPANGLHDPEDAKAAARRYGVRSEGDQEGENEQGRREIADGGEGESARKESRSGALDQREDGRRGNPDFRARTQGGTSLVFILRG